MSRVLTFSRVFPAYHPKVGQDTGFVQKILDSLLIDELITTSRYAELCRESGIPMDLYQARARTLQPKHHTIRAGNRWKPGDKFSPRVWSDTPRRSKQLAIAPDIEVKKVWQFEMNEDGIMMIGKKVVFDLLVDNNFQHDEILTEILAQNDGLSVEDFRAWLAIHPKKTANSFSGQIICWSDTVQY